MPRWMRGYGRCRGRPPIEVKSRLNIEDTIFLPVKGVSGLSQADIVEIYDYEIEAMKLIHIDGLSTDEAANLMNVSKATFWRILESCRFKIADALSSGKPIKLVSKKLDKNNE
ncbi:MAG: DUF134 domain-containing protein [Fervidicoccaceae archaeon]|nr:MAG: hypothetical protein C0179_00250 [Fervidicoccus sp.]